MTRRAAVLAAVLVAAGVVRAAGPEAIAPEVAPGDAVPGAAVLGPPSLFASLDTTSTTVGGVLYLTLETEPAEGWAVDPPTRALDLDPFRVREVVTLPRPGGPAWRLRLLATKAGDVEVPAVTLTARGPGGRSEVIASVPIPVTVTSNLEEAAGDSAGTGPQPADLKPPLEARRNWIPLLIAAGTALAAAALGFWLARRLRRRARPEAAPPPAERRPLRPPWEVAIESLDRIAAADYVGQGQIDRQYVEVTGALRRYLEDRYGVPALESTTTDLGHHLERAPLRPEMSSRILSLLREADLVKFAKALPESAQARSTEGRAREVVLSTMPRPEPAPPAEETPA